MNNFGLIHEKLDLKILILFILRRLQEQIDIDALSQIVLIDGGMTYFDFAECLSELCNAELAVEVENGFRITEKGAENVSVIENSLPFSVREKAENAIRPIASAMRRSSMIRAEHSRQKDGSSLVELGLSDGFGEMISLKLLVSDEAMAESIEHNFKSDAEGYFQKIIDILV